MAINDVEKVFFLTGANIESSWVTDLDKDNNIEFIIQFRSEKPESNANLLIFVYDQLDAIIRKSELPSLPYAYTLNYRGKDDYNITGDMILRSYPAYNHNDSKCCPTGGKFFIYYVLSGSLIRIKKVERELNSNKLMMFNDENPFKEQLIAKQEQSELNANKELIAKLKETYSIVYKDSIPRYMKGIGFGKYFLGQKGSKMSKESKVISVTIKGERSKADIVLYSTKISNQIMRIDVTLHKGGKPNGCYLTTKEIMDAYIQKYGNDYKIYNVSPVQINRKGSIIGATKHVELEWLPSKTKVISLNIKSMPNKPYIDYNEYNDTIEDKFNPIEIFYLDISLWELNKEEEKLLIQRKKNESPGEI